LTSSEVYRTGQTPDHQELERFVRHLSMPPESVGITSNAFGRSSATTISHTRAVRLSILQPVAPEDFGSLTCACRPPQSVFGHSPESSDSTGSSYPRLLRKCGLCVSHGLFGAYQNAFGCSPGISPLGSWGCKAPLGFAARTAECEELRFFTRKASAFHRQASAYQLRRASVLLRA
jgi:hypothetical protein